MTDQNFFPPPYLVCLGISQRGSRRLVEPQTLAEDTQRKEDINDNTTVYVEEDEHEVLQSAFVLPFRES